MVPMVQGSEVDVLAAKVSCVSIDDEQHALQSLSSVLRADTNLWLQFYNTIFSSVSS